MKRTIMLVLGLTFCLHYSWAEDEYEAPEVIESNIYNLNEDKNFVEPNIFTVETGIGSSFELGIGLRHNFNKYLSWDILNVKYSLDYLYESYGYHYNDNNLNEFSLTSGVRAFTPTLGHSQFKLFLACDLGYAVVSRQEKCEHYVSGYKYNNYYWSSTGGSYQYHERRQASHHFALDMTAGFYVCKSISLGAGFRYITDAENRGHVTGLARIGIDF